MRAAVDHRPAGRAGRARRLHLFRRRGGPAGRRREAEGVRALGRRHRGAAIKNADGETSHRAADGDNWQIIEPNKADADGGVVGTVTSSLARLEVQRVVDENPSDLAQYGLEPAASTSFRGRTRRSSSVCSSATRRRPAATCTRKRATRSGCS